ncbi:hypothetical protein OIU84_021985, partial [Salix udensis]
MERIMKMRKQDHQILTGWYQSKKKIEQAGQEDEAGSWSKLSIYRVPHYLREVDDKAYVPPDHLPGALPPWQRKRLRQM